MTKRKKTKFPGVQQRESESRRYKGRPDICFTIDYKDASGKRVRKDVGWTSEGFTAALAAEMRARLLHEAKTCETLGSTTPKKAPLFQEAWERYKKDWLIAQGKDHKEAQGLIRLYLEPLLEKPLDQITPYILDGLMNEMRGKGLSPQTIKHALALVRRVMRRMSLWGLYNGPMPFDKIALPKPDNARERFLTPQEAAALLDELKKRSRAVWLMALISLHCGLRLGEIARMRPEDIRMDERTIFIPQSKNGRSRHAVMTEAVAAALASYMAGMSGSDLVFPNSNGGMRKETPEVFFMAVKKLGLNGPADAPITDRRQRICFHSLRHTYASWLAKSGQGQLVIADRLGHHSLAMTNRYTHLMDETRRASAAAIDRIFHGEAPENQS